MAGFHAAYLRFDLGRGVGERIEIPEKILRRYLGGVGLGAWLLHRECPVGAHPLDPRAPLVFAFSPLAGTPVTTSAKFAVVAKSPLTGFFCDAMSSSQFAISAKRLGVDALVFVGRCDVPSIWVNGEVEATDLWGAPPAEVEHALAARGSVASIGVAGEKGVPFATISNQGRHAGRGGLGAVMGAKRLKAIVAGGDVVTPCHDPTRLREIASDLRGRSRGPATLKYRELGTVANLSAFNRLGLLPTRNFQSGQFRGAEALSGETLVAERQEERASCASCTIGCEHRFRTAGGGAARLEYESLFALGSLCEISDPDSVLAAAARCDALGLDTVSTGATIAFAMECRERGLIDDPDAPSFGDGDRLLVLLDEIARREGFGARLSAGSYRLARTIGGGALAFAPQVKGLELPGYEPRLLHSMALGFAVGTRGADHNRSSAYEADFSDAVDRLHGDDRSAAHAVRTEDRAAILDSVVLCKFLRGAFHDLEVELADLLSALTGWAFTPAELVAAAKRIVALRKAFNIREGWRPADDTLPERFLSEGIDGSENALSPERLDGMVARYYELRGWDSDGYLPGITEPEFRADGIELGPSLVDVGRRERDNFLSHEL